MGKSGELERIISRTKNKGIQSLEITFPSSKVYSSQHRIHSPKQIQRIPAGAGVKWSIQVSTTQSFTDNCLGIPMSRVPFPGSFTIFRGQWVHMASVTTSQTMPNSESITEMHSDEAVAHYAIKLMLETYLLFFLISVTKPIQV